MSRTGFGSPTYDLSNAKDLVIKGRFSITKGVANWLFNHYDNSPKEIIKAVFEEIQTVGFRKTMALDNKPGTMADVYGTEYDDITWYVKFFIDSSEGEEKLRVEVWSCRWDGNKIY